MHSAFIFWDLSKFDNRNRFTFNFDLTKNIIDLIFKFFDDQVTSILPEATMIHQKSEICVKFVAKFCWKTENSQEKMVVTTQLKNVRGDIVLVYIFGVSPPKCPGNNAAQR